MTMVDLFVFLFLLAVIIMSAASALMACLLMKLLARKEKSVDIDSPNYDVSLAAALVIYQELFPNPEKPQAMVIGKLTFIIMHALKDVERRRSLANCEPSAN